MEMVRVEAGEGHVVGFPLQETEVVEKLIAPVGIVEGPEFCTNERVIVIPPLPLVPMVMS